VRSLSPVVGVGLVHNNIRLWSRLWFWLGAARFAGTLLGPEATPSGVVAPSWWWGVVFVYWIVVASI
jgi:hypothetical protein